MKRGRSPAVLIRKAAGPALALLVIGNFAGYAIAGPNGLLALGSYKQELAAKQAQLKQIDTQRDELAHKVALLNQKHVDPDMADELVRRELGVVRPDEVILQTP